MPRSRTFVAGVLLGASVLTVIGAGALYWSVTEFRRRFPDQDIFNTARLHDSVAILLGKDVALSRFQPRPMLVVQRQTVTRAAYPAIDVHFHLESLDPSITPERLVQAMDAAGIDKVVNLGGLPGVFEELASKFRARYPERFIMFVKPDLAGLRADDNFQKQLQWVEKAIGMGARGIKFSKSFGMGQRDASGKIIPVDDPRLDPLWDLAARAGMPVLIHTGEPAAFFARPDVHNERFEELAMLPQFRHYGKPPTREDLMSQRERLLARHPHTNFIGAHVGMNEDDLGYASYLLDKYPNYYVDIAAVVHALGRQPYTARRFFIRYQDRILFGTDGGYGLVKEGAGWTPERYFRSYLEFLETENEYFEYPLADVSKQGRWRVYGLHLPPEVLEKIYVRNAERLIPTEDAIAARLAISPSPAN
jgi:predicted TIM-barrel fold metal-dependent hydrolase